MLVLLSHCCCWRAASNPGPDTPTLTTPGNESLVTPQLPPATTIAQFSSVLTDDDGNLPYMDMRTLSELSNINIYPELVRKFLCKLPNKVSRSPDGSPAAVLTMLSYELCTPLCIIFKKSLDSGTHPSLWKLGDITPVFKKGVASVASNYRPMTILSAMCRLFERILADNISDHLNMHKLVTDAQYCFLKGRSTELQLLNCTDPWIKSIDKRQITMQSNLLRNIRSHRELLH